MSSYLPLSLHVFNIMSSLKPWGSSCANKYFLPHSTSLPPGMRTAAYTFHEGFFLFLLHSLSEPGSSLCNLPGSSLHWHSAEPIWLVLCQQRMLPPTVLLFHQTWDWSHLLQSSAFHDAILLFLSPPSQNRQQPHLAQLWAHRTCAVPTKIAPPQYFPSTSQETGHISNPQPSVMQSSYSSLLPLRTGSNLSWHSSEPRGLVLCQQKLLRHSISLPPAKRLAT